MRNISTCLWFDDNAEEAVAFYTSVFKNSRVGATSHYGESGAQASGRPEGSVMTIAFELEGQEFLALNGGPQFTFSPAISQFVSCDSEKEIDNLFEKLSDGGFVLMELEKYSFSKKFAFVNDKFGASWQLNLSPREQKITPFLMFVGHQYGKAEEAVNFYVEQFENSKIISIERWGAEDDEPQGMVKHAIFSIAGQEFMALDSAKPHPFTFSMATSFILHCENQKEVDRFWKDLSNGGEPGQCGWLMDKYGVSWQVVPAALEDWLKEDDEKTEQVMKALMEMTKLDIATLEKAHAR